MDEKGELVFSTTFSFEDSQYEVCVFCRDDGHHLAETSFDANDVIINDGASLQEALDRHLALLPVAISTRRIMRLRMPPSF
ncbi:MAG TPA: hypothetical protein VFR01_07570 [Geobacterales bacterium]|nr:hypothetical protein [Geobacterales bacterium]